MKLKIIVTAGPTLESIDPVRYISNYSSGAMGYAIAKEARARGHKVALISGPVKIKPPRFIKPVCIQTAQDLLRELSRRIKSCDCLIMAAAVCDFKPQVASAQKIKRGAGLILKLKKTPDILKAVAKFKKNKLFVGFALESNSILKNAQKKLQDKNLDLIVANAAGSHASPFGNKKTTVWVCDKQGGCKVLKNVAKSLVAKRLLDRVEELCYFRQLQ